MLSIFREHVQAGLYRSHLHGPRLRILLVLNQAMAERTERSFSDASSQEGSEWERGEASGDLRICCFDLLDFLIQQILSQDAALRTRSLSSRTCWSEPSHPSRPPTTRPADAGYASVCKGLQGGMDWDFGDV